MIKKNTLIFVKFAIIFSRVNLNMDLHQPHSNFPPNLYLIKPYSPTQYN